MTTALQQLQDADAAETAELGVVAQALTDETTRVNALIETLQNPSSDDAAIAAVAADLTAHTTNLQTIASALAAVAAAAPPAPAQPISTVTTLSAAPTSTAGSDISLTANVTGAGTGEPTGTVTFVKDGVPMGQSALDANGTAVFVDPSVTAGSYSYSAIYGGDAQYATSTSSVSTTTVAAAGAATTAAPVTETL